MAIPKEFETAAKLLPLALGAQACQAVSSTPEATPILYPEALTIDIANQALYPWMEITLGPDELKVDPPVIFIGYDNAPEKLITASPLVNGRADGSVQWALGIANLKGKNDTFGPLPFFVGYNNQNGETRVFGLVKDETVSNDTHLEFIGIVVQEGQLYKTEQRLVINETTKDDGSKTNELSWLNEDTKEKTVLTATPTSDNPSPTPTEVPPALIDELVAFLTGATPVQAATLEETPTPPAIVTPVLPENTPTAPALFPTATAKSTKAPTQPPPAAVSPAAPTPEPSPTIPPVERFHAGLPETFAQSDVMRWDHISEDLAAARKVDKAYVEANNLKATKVTSFDGKVQQEPSRRAFTTYRMWNSENPIVSVRQMEMNGSQVAVLGFLVLGTDNVQRIMYGAIDLNGIPNMKNLADFTADTHILQPLRERKNIVILDVATRPVWSTTITGFENLQEILDWANNGTNGSDNRSFSWNFIGIWQQAIEGTTPENKGLDAMWDEVVDKLVPIHLIRITDKLY